MSNAAGRITRPHSNATPDDLRTYLRSIGAALEAVGVGHGEEFIVAPARTAARNGLYDLERHDEDAVGAAAQSPASARSALMNLPRSGSQRHRILEAAVAAGDKGITSDEASAALGIPLQSSKPRMLELRVGGWLALTGGTRRSAAGAKVEVHTATSKAREALGHAVAAIPPSEPERLFEPPRQSALAAAPVG